MSYKDKCIDYFEIWNIQDVELLRKCFAEDVILRDWEILANGVDDYLFNERPVKDEEKDEVYDEEKVVIVVDNGREQEASGVTLAFNEKANRWTSFYTFYPEYYSSIQRTFVSFNGH